MRKVLLLVVAMMAAPAAPATARADEPGGEDPWKVLADVNRVAVGWSSDKAKAAFDKANTAWGDLEPTYTAALADWNKNKKLYEVRMPASVYGETMGSLLVAVFDKDDGDTKYNAGSTFAAQASLAIDYGDLAYALGDYETANGYYESAYSIYEWSAMAFNDSAAYYLASLADCVGAATLMALYP